jgi:hypothetical protein
MYMMRSKKDRSDKVHLSFLVIMNSDSIKEAPREEKKKKEDKHDMFLSQATTLLLDNLHIQQVAPSKYPGFWPVLAHLTGISAEELFGRVLAYYDENGKHRIPRGQIVEGDPYGYWTPTILQLIADCLEINIHAHCANERGTMREKIFLCKTNVAVAKEKAIRLMVAEKEPGFFALKRCI